MTAYGLTAVRTLTVIAGLGLIFATHVMSKKESTTGPEAAGLVLPWIGFTFGFASGASRFLVPCQLSSSRSVLC
ncbi:hypothetical protein EDC04DRAFT_2657609, partial [Pisolithus marmoratus]